MFRHKWLRLALCIAAFAGNARSDDVVDPASLKSIQAAFTRVNQRLAELAKQNGDLARKVEQLEMQAAPIGTIVAFAGPLDTVPPNWKVCNGDAVDRNAETEGLYNAIRSSWGGTSSRFLLPDLRGRFLRGVNQGSGHDPDVGQRTALATGGNALDNVGSFQGEQVGKHRHHITDPGHTHPIRWSQGPPARGDAVFERTNRDVPEIPEATPTTKPAKINVEWVDENRTAGDTLPNENRPANVSVYWIIRVK